MVIQGGKFFPPEWFDFDREEKVTHFFGDEPLPDDSPDLRDEVGCVCPYCESSLCEYLGEQYDDEHHEGSAYKCHDCGLSFCDGDRTLGIW